MLRAKTLTTAVVWLAAFLCTRLPVLQLLQANPWKRLLLLHRNLLITWQLLLLLLKVLLIPQPVWNRSYCRRHYGIGMGQHGEGGGGTQPMKSADETAAIMMDALLKDLDVKAGES